MIVKKGNNIIYDAHLQSGSDGISATDVSMTNVTDIINSVSRRAEQLAADAEKEHEEVSTALADQINLIAKLREAIAAQDVIIADLQLDINHMASWLKELTAGLIIIGVVSLVAFVIQFIS